jgi:hypothetical protein
MIDGAGSRTFDRRSAVALILVLLVLSSLAVIGAPFVVSMLLHDRASRNFAGEVEARLAAEAARNHAIARLERTAHPVEWEEEAERLEAERPRISLQSGSLRQPGRATASRRGSVVRADLGAGRGSRQRGASERSGDEREGGDGGPLPDAFRISEKGPSPRDYDTADELDTALPGRLKLPAEAPEDPNALDDPSLFSFANPRGLSASADVTDEQGKININTAPPNLIAAIFGVSQLARPLGPRDRTIYLDDATPFRGDSDRETIDGAVVLVSEGGTVLEAVTYRRVEGDALHDCFRGDFLSLPSPPQGTLPIGTFVYDLRGWKVGYHRLWSQRFGGFHPDRLTEFRSIEAIREIAGWQIASLFIGRFRGEGLTAQFLRDSGVSLRRLADMGIDPTIFTGEEREITPEQRKELDAARSRLRRLRFDARLIRSLEQERGPQVLLDLSARLEGASRAEVEKMEQDLKKALATDKRRSGRFDPQFLRAALEQLARSYQTAGLETILAEDLERHRDALTVSSELPCRWGEAQAILSDLAMAGPDYQVRVPRASELGPRTLVRLRSRDGEEAEFNEVAASDGAHEGGIRLAFPVRASYSAYGATVQALERHPINANTATRKVLRAVFTGVRGRGQQRAISPYKADRLAEMVMGSRPLRDHDGFHSLLVKAASAQVIDEEDIQPLLINAVQPNSYFLRTSTTGLCYATGDVYTIESRGILRSPSGSELAHSRFREIVEVSPAGILQTGLLTQRDMTDGVYLRDPYLGRGFPENHHQFLIPFSGTRSHLVMSRPLLLHRTLVGLGMSQGGQKKESLIGAFAGGDLGSLRLFPAETPDVRDRFTVGDILHFRNTYEGLELAHGEPFVLPIPAEEETGPGRQAIAVPAGAAGTEPAAPADLTMVPGGVEFWFRMRTYPEALSTDGQHVILEGGTGTDRNQVALLYDHGRGRVLFRLYDSSLPDPSVLVNKETGQYLQVEALRTLELETWYHVRLAWDGVFGGGAQLFIDGIPAGSDNLSTELAGAIPATGQVVSISVKDASRFPHQGVVRIDGELFEYERKAGNLLQVRREPPSGWKPWPPRQLEVADAAAGRRGRPGGGPQQPSDPDDPLNLPPGHDNMRSPWNRRGASAAAHAPGAMVSLHGYSLEMRRKLWLPNRDGNMEQRQVPDGDLQLLVWGSGGLRSREPLPAHSFPLEVRALIHYVDLSAAQREGVPGGGRGGGQGPGGGPSTAGGGQWIVPHFLLDPENQPPGASGGGRQGGGPGGGPLLRALYTAELPQYRRNAADYFQSKGICLAGGRAVIYEKRPLPAEYVAAQKADQLIEMEQLTGLFIVGDYEPWGSAAIPGLNLRGREQQQGAARSIPNDARLLQISILANGPIQGRYPGTGVLELRGMPPPWEQAAGRPNKLGQPLFQSHPDDTVEWLRYYDIHENLFVGPRSTAFRGYPVRDQQLKRQLDLPAGEALRLVMELSQGGAGHGDYVTIASGNPAVYEPAVRRIYKVLEHGDGRFFVSLVDVDSSGREIPGGGGLYRHNYFRGMNPRLVKFPSWGLPEVSTGSLVFFGNVEASGAGGAGRSNLGGMRYREDDDPTGVTIDEIRRMRNTAIPYSSIYGPRVRHVVVPLENGRVKFQSGMEGEASISGVIPAGRAISPGNPLEVFVVAVSTERIQPTLFAHGQDEGVLRIGSELFYFEDPRGEASVVQMGTARVRLTESYDPGRGNQPGQIVLANPLAQERQRNPLARQTVFPRLEVTGMQGYFEPQGFARIRDSFIERWDFYEIFYYDRLAGGFSDCLRGQFQTPILASSISAEANPVVQNVTRRLRLTGRALLGTQPASHGLGAPVELMPYLTISPLMGPMTSTGLPVKDSRFFSPAGGYVLIDPAVPGQPWEIIAHLGREGNNLLARPRDEKGEGFLRARFGTTLRPIASGMFAYEMPFRYYDRYEAEAEGEALAYFQKAFRVPGAYWRRIEWRERPSRRGQDLRCDIVVLARFDGAPDWAEKPTQEKGGLFFFEDREHRSRTVPSFEIGQAADEIEIRVYFRYRSGAFTRIQRPGGDLFTDDWKETPVLDSLTLEYEKDGVIVRHEELPF